MEVPTLDESERPGNDGKEGKTLVDHQIRVVSQGSVNPYTYMEKVNIYNTLDLCLVHKDNFFTSRVDPVSSVWVRQRRTGETILKTRVGDWCRLRRSKEQKTQTYW